MTGESEETFKKGRMVEATVVYVGPTLVRVRAWLLRLVQQRIQVTLL